jgi:deazaflavin-dependent oxidoreductase (nitroreductase family)
MSTYYDFNQANIREFRANGGKVGGPFEGKTLLLLHATGAKTGEEHVTPVAYIRDGRRYVIIASKAGAPTNPAWYYNLLAHPQVTIEVGTDTLRAQVSVAPEPERTRLYARMTEYMPGFAEYQKKTTRVIPVILLEPETP